VTPPECTDARRRPPELLSKLWSLLSEPVNAYSRTDGDLTLYTATTDADSVGRVRYDGVAFFPKGQWHGIVKVQGEAREIEAPRRIGFQPPEESTG
jgi:hypothetical protein